MQSHGPVLDEVSREWREQVGQEKLTVQFCSNCGTHQFYPRPFCIGCNADSISLVEVSGRGKLHSWTTVHKGAYKQLPPPYVIALVDLAEGVRMLTRLVECDGVSLQCDMTVVLRWTDGKDASTLPVWAPAAAFD